MTVSWIATDSDYHAEMARPKITQDSVIDVAERMIDTDGLDALSARRISAELGVSRQVIYTHFSGMHELFEALLHRSGLELAASVENLTQPTGSDERVRASAHAYVAFARRRPALFELTFGRPVPGYTPSPETTEALRNVFLSHVVGLIDDWSTANKHDLGRKAIVERTRVYWSATHGLVTLERAGHSSERETDTLVDEAVRALLAGWRHPQ